MIIKNWKSGRLWRIALSWDVKKPKKRLCIDPGDEADRILMTLAKSELKVKYLLNTHGHFDHVGANKRMKEVTGAQLAIHKEDEPFFAQLSQSAMMFGLVAENSPPADFNLNEGDKITFGEITLEVIHTPGHSKGGVCLYTKGHLFAGDTLFAGSIGRTDLDGGNYDTLISSIKTKLLALDDDTVVYTGHGPETTIANEKRMNPLFEMNRFLEHLPNLRGIFEKNVSINGSFEQIAARFAKEKGTVLLLSGSDLDCARYHMLAVAPWLEVTSRREQVSMTCGLKSVQADADPFDVLTMLTDRFGLDGTGFDLPVHSGLFGYFSYDLKDRLEQLPCTCTDTNLPDLCLFSPSIILIEDKTTAERRLCLPQWDQEYDIGIAGAAVDNRIRWFLEKAGEDPDLGNFSIDAKGFVFRESAKRNIFGPLRKSSPIFRPATSTRPISRNGLKRDFQGTLMPCFWTCSVVIQHHFSAIFRPVTTQWSPPLLNDSSNRRGDLWKHGPSKARWLEARIQSRIKKTAKHCFQV